MARQRFVTRTISEHNIKATVVNADTEEVFKAIYQVSGAIPADDTKAIKKAVQALLSGDMTVLKIEYLDTTSCVYGMPEEQFMMFARIIDR